MCDSARSLSLRAFDLSGHDSYMQVSCAQVFALCGERQESREFLDQFYAARQGKPTDAYQLAEAFALLHDTTNAYSWLERACWEKSQGLIVLRVDQAWDFQRSNPHYLAVLKRIHLDQSSK